jgi:hypothetical protein
VTLDLAQLLGTQRPLFAFDFLNFLSLTLLVLFSTNLLLASHYLLLLKHWITAQFYAATSNKQLVEISFKLKDSSVYQAVCFVVF